MCSFTKRFSGTRKSAYFSFGPDCGVTLYYVVDGYCEVIKKPVKIQDQNLFGFLTFIEATSPQFLQNVIIRGEPIEKGLSVGFKFE